MGFSCGHTTPAAFYRDLGESSVDVNVCWGGGKAALSIIHIRNRPRNHSSRVKASSCQGNQSLESTPASTMADTTLSYGDGDAAKLVKIH